MNSFLKRQILVAKKRPFQWCLVVVLCCLTFPPAFTLALIADALIKVSRGISWVAIRPIEGTQIQTTFRAVWGESNSLRELREADDA